MRVLLDTNALLWWLAADPRLSTEAAEVIAEGSNDVYVSSVSATEIATKVLIGKLRAPSDLRQRMQEGYLQELPVRLEHGLAVGDLPLHHRDPFDRLLVAQARCEELTLVTSDAKLHAYDVQILSAN